MSVRLSSTGDTTMDKRTLISILILLLLLALPGELSRAQEPPPGDDPRQESPLAVDQEVRGAFVYQGELREDGVPIDGTRRMVFQLYTDSGCTVDVGDETAEEVEVSNGLFTVEVLGTDYPINGQQLWLGTAVGPAGSEEAIGCQEIMPVPYAISLRPGARIEGEMYNWDAIHAVNTATSGASYGVYGRTYSPGGRGVYGFASASSGTNSGVLGLSQSPAGFGVYGENNSGTGNAVGVHGVSGAPMGWAVYGTATAESGTNYGVYGKSESTTGRGVMGLANASSGENYGVYGETESSSGAGVFATGAGTGADLILGGVSSSTTGDDGRIYSDPRFPSSDIHIHVNDGIRIDLNEDGSDEPSDFEIRDKDNVLLFNVHDDGTVTFKDKDNKVVFKIYYGGDVEFGGTGLAAFPKPAYDSGWVDKTDFGGSSCKNFAHNLGGSTDKYVVDLQFKDGSNITNSGFGGDNDGPGGRGGIWQNLTSTHIELCFWYGDVALDAIRARIWVYK
jgi:hypothetical protein